jgi:hypothetical protein
MLLEAIDNITFNTKSGKIASSKKLIVDNGEINLKMNQTLQLSLLW